jgi:hypothetical protein
MDFEPTYLSNVLLCNLFLVKNHANGCEKQDDTMAKVAEHDSKQKRESDNGEKAGVDLLISCYTVAIDYALETFSKFVGAMECWRLARGSKFMENWRNVRSGNFLYVQHVRVFHIGTCTL